MRDGSRNRQTDLQTLSHGEPSSPFQFALESLGSVSIRVDFLAGRFVICEFHYVIEVAFGIIPPDMKNAYLAFVRAGDWFEFLDAAKLAFVGTLVLEGA